MRILKLVIWDLDETILTGILEEGDNEVNPLAYRVMNQLNERGVLQALATQNPSSVLGVLEEFDWFTLFVRSEASLGPKARKVENILEELGVNPLDAVFVDEDPFERGSISAQIPHITTWSVAEMAAFLEGRTDTVTEEAQRRPAMYREQQARTQAAESATNHTDFLRACNIEIIIRPYEPQDASRVEELLTRTHRMNLGVLPVDEAIARLNQPAAHNVIIAEMRDIYGDLGRCGIIHLTEGEQGEAIIESLAISCRTRARGLSLAMLVGLLRYARNYQKYHCRYISNGANRPLRMLLMGAGFKPLPGTDQLLLTADKLAEIELPDWVHIKEQPILLKRGICMVDTIPNNQEIQDAVIGVVMSTLRKKSKNFGFDDPLLSSNGHFDSFSLMELVLHLEERFNIEIPDSDLDPDVFHSVNTITDYIRGRLVE